MENIANWTLAEHLLAFIVGPMITVVLIWAFANLYEKFCDWDNARKDG